MQHSSPYHQINLSIPIKLSINSPIGFFMLGVYKYTRFLKCLFSLLLSKLFVFHFSITTATKTKLSLQNTLSAL
jgi:hypothetical protein